MVSLKLYNQSSLGDLHLPALYQYLSDYARSLISLEANTFISNVNTQMNILQVNEHFFPITINEAEYDNAYVCSPYTAYISYGKQELWKLHNKPLEKALSLVLKSLDPIFKASGINKVICLNNWLLSTNLYPNWNGDEGIPEILEFLTSTFPHHAILFRSLNEYTNRELMQNLKKNDFKLIPSREIFIFDKALKKYIRKRNTVIDLKFLNKTPYYVVGHEDISVNDYGAIVRLYEKLYFEKYSDCSPHFTEAFIRLCHEKKLLKMQGLRNRDGHLEGIIGSFTRNGVLATPLVGYNTDQPRSEGLFRLITALALKEAFENNYVFNISAGVSQFKRWRGAVGFIEYNAVFDQHLPFKQRAAWNAIHFLMKNIGIPLLHKYQF